MKGVLDFIKTSVLGGLLVLLPAYLSVILMLRVVASALALIAPLTAHLPGGPHIAQVLAIVLVIAVSFLIGLVVRTQLGKRANEFVEQRLLDRIPGYTTLRSLTRRFSGEGVEGADFAVALVEIEEALVPAFLVEEHPDGSFTVFVPSVPTPAAGSVYILSHERVHRVAVPFASAVKCITRWGAGSGELLQAMQRGAPAH